MTLNFGSCCSGIEAASVAFGPLGWKAAWFSEIEPFPCAVLAHHYPEVPNLGDMTTLVRRILQGDVAAPDLLCGGTPCQAFSVAGKRQSLDDARGNLTLTFCEIADAIDHVRAARGEQPAVILWENVPGVLSTRDNAFGCFLGEISGSGSELQPPGGRWTDAGCVYGPTRAVAWRVLDAQFFQLAQRRRRVFVVASARNGFDPGAVLFESDGVRRDSPPSREARQTAPTIPARSTAGGGLGTDFDCDGGTICVATGQAGAEIGANMAPTLNCNHEAPYVAHSLRGEGFDASARPRKAKDGEPRAFLDAHVDYQGDGCVIWPFGRFKSGYGSVGRNERAHRLMCELAHGPAPDGYDAAHSCGRRLCINPLHLRWATRADNMADAIAHGTTTRGEKHGAARLTEAAALDILARLMAGETHDAIAAAHGVARTTVTDIAKGKNWAWLSAQDGTGRGTPLVPAMRPIGFSAQMSVPQVDVDLMQTLQAKNPMAVAVALRGREDGATAELGDDVSFALRASSGGGDKPHVLAFSCKDSGQDVGEISPTLRAMGGTQPNGGGQVAVAFAIQAGALRTNPNSGPDGVGVQADHAYTLEARAEVQAVAIRTAQTGSNGWGINTDGVAYTLDSAQQAVATYTLGGGYGRLDGGASPGADDLPAWPMREMHGKQGGGASQERGLEGQPTGKSGAALPELPHEGTPDAEALRDLRGAAEGAGVLREALPAFQAMGRPDEGGNPGTESLSGVRCGGPQSWALREALHAEEARQAGASAEDSERGGIGGLGNSQTYAVRRLTPVECERLMGFPDSYTSIPWRKKPAEDCPDGPRYRALGNSWAVPVVSWVGRRIAAALQLRAAA